MNHGSLPSFLVKKAISAMLQMLKARLQTIGELCLFIIVLGRTCWHCSADYRSPMPQLLSKTIISGLFLSWWYSPAICLYCNFASISDTPGPSPKILRAWDMLRPTLSARTGSFSQCFGLNAEGGVVVGGGGGSAMGGGGRQCGGVGGCSSSEFLWVLSVGGGTGGGGTLALRRGGGPHAVGCSGRGASEWSRQWTRAIQYLLSDASLIQFLSEPEQFMVVVGT
jgi:hypothetical protein